MQFVKQSTETYVIIGPFVDVSDGFTPETGVTLAAADEAEIIKHSTTSVTDISGGTMAAVASCDGYYALTLTTAYTDTLGRMTVVIQDDSVCLPVRADFQVVPANVYDSLFGSDKLQVHADEITAGLITATAIADSAIDLATFAADCKTGSALKANVETITAGVIANASFNADVGSTAYATNIIALAVRKVLDELNLDHLLKVACSSNTDLSTEVADGTILANVLAKADGETSDFSPATDSLEAVGEAAAAILADTGTDGVVLAADAITSAKIADNAISAEHIAANALTAAKFAADVKV